LTQAVVGLAGSDVCRPCRGLSDGRDSPAVTPTVRPL